MDTSILPSIDSLEGELLQQPTDTRQENLKEINAVLGLEEGEAQIIHDMLVAGISLPQIAESRALTGQEVQDLMNSQDFIKQVKKSVMLLHTNRANTNALIDEVELSALERIKQQVPNMSPAQLVTTFAILNKSTRHSLAKSGESKVSEDALSEETLVLDILPPTKPKVLTNEQGQILEVNGQTTQTMTLDQLREEAKRYDTDKKSITQQD